MPGPDKKMPCKGCLDRQTGERDRDCHTDCKAYAEYVDKYRKNKVFVQRLNRMRNFPTTTRYSKSSGRYVAPRGITHKKQV